jgi:hypothetical protein
MLRIPAGDVDADVRRARAQHRRDAERERVARIAEQLRTVDEARPAVVLYVPDPTPVPSTLAARHAARGAFLCRAHAAEAMSCG